MARLVWQRHYIDGIRTVLRGGGTQSAIKELIEPVAARANELAQEKDAEYKAYADIGQYTAIGKVVCGNAAARHDNSHNNTLLKARW